MYERVLRKHDFRCHWSGRPIRPGDAWDLDHVKALINGGENRESNLAPILRGKEHKEKTAQDVALKSRSSKRLKSAYGITKRAKRKSSGRGFIGWRRMNGERVWAKGRK